MAIGIRQRATGTYKLWIGDLAGTINDANAIMYVKDNGSAYFGGSLTAGALIAQAVNNIVLATATVETGTFTTNGNSKAVTFSLSYSNNGTLPSPISSSNSATLRLDRSYNGGAWTQIATASCSGTTNSTYDAEFGVYRVTCTCGGSGSFTDTQTGTGTFNYRVRITNNSGQWPLMLQQGANWFNGNQALRVRSVEG